METEIHNIELEAYYHVIRAFRAQSDAISWEKQEFMRKIRKELRVSEEENIELLSWVKNDDTIQRISECSKANGLQSGELRSFRPVHESITSSSLSASRKKMKIGQSTGSLSVCPPHPALKRGPSIVGRGTKPEAIPYLATDHSGRAANGNHGSAFGDSELAKSAVVDALIGRTVWIKWPSDGKFYEAVIKDFKKGELALVYDIGTPTETLEWVDLKTMTPVDVRWEGEDPAIFRRGCISGQDHGSKKPSIPGGAVGSARRVHGTFKGLTKKDLFIPQNGIAEKRTTNVKLLHTDTLIKEVEKVFSGSHLNMADIEEAKKLLKEHEQALVEAIARLEVPFDGECDEVTRKGVV